MRIDGTRTHLLRKMSTALPRMRNEFSSAPIFMSITSSPSDSYGQQMWCLASHPPHFTTSESLKTLYDI